MLLQAIHARLELDDIGLFVDLRTARCRRMPSAMAWLASEPFAIAIP